MPRPFLLAIPIALAGAGAGVTQTATTTVHDELVVTATLAEEERQDLPATVRVVDAETAAARQTSTLADLLGPVPGVSPVRLGPPGQQTSLFVRGAESDQVLVLWNGIPLNDPFFGAFNGAHLGLDGLDRVEVVPGPFSALYGSSAVGGVIQVLTARDDRARVVAEVGERGSARLAPEWGRSLGNGVHGFVAGHLRELDGELDNDGDRGGEGHGRLLWERGPGSVAVVGRAAEAETGVPTSGFAPTPRRSLAWSERQVALPGSWTGPLWQVEARLSRARTESRYRDPDDPWSAPSDTEATADRARGVVTRTLGETRAWVAAGGEWERLEAEQDSPFAVVGPLDKRSTGVFAQAHVEGASWSAQLGVRRDDDEAYGATTNPRLGATWAVRSDLRLRASYGEAFRAPSLGELYYPYFGNPELEPEESASAELGASWARGAWSFDVAAFETEQENLIDFDATFRSVNVGRARSRGVEAQVGFRGRRWRAELAGSWLDARDLERDVPLRRRAEHSGSLALDWAPGGWTWSLVAVAVGRRPDTDPATGAPATNPGFARVDVATSRRLGERISVRARVDNLLDTGYEPALGFPAPGRSLTLGVEVDW